MHKVTKRQKYFGAYLIVSIVNTVMVTRRRIRDGLSLWKPIWPTKSEVALSVLGGVLYYKFLMTTEEEEELA